MMHFGAAFQIQFFVVVAKIRFFFFSLNLFNSPMYLVVGTYCNIFFFVHSFEFSLSFDLLNDFTQFHTMTKSILLVFIYLKTQKNEKQKTKNSAEKYKIIRDSHMNHSQVCENCRRERSIQITARIMINWCDENLKLHRMFEQSDVCGLAYSRLSSIVYGIFYTRDVRMWVWRAQTQPACTLYHWTVRFVLFARDAVSAWTSTQTVCLQCITTHFSFDGRLLFQMPAMETKPCVWEQIVPRYKFCLYTQHPQFQNGKRGRSRVCALLENRDAFGVDRETQAHIMMRCCRPRGKIICFVCI